MRESRTSEIKMPDGWITVIYIALVIFGWFNIYSTQSDASSLFDFSRKYGIQLVWIGVAFITAIVVMIINSRFYPVFAYHIYTVAVLLLILTLVAGVEVNSSKSWLSFGVIRIQPSEIAKLATALMLARLAGSNDFRFNSFDRWMQAIMILALPLGLVLLQRDWGSALVFTSFMLMFYREGMSGWILIYVIFTVLLFISALLVAKTWIISAIVPVTFIIYFFTGANYKYVLRVLLFGILLFLAGVIYKNVAHSSLSYANLIVFSVGTVLVISQLYALFLRMKPKFYHILFFAYSIVALSIIEPVYNDVLKPHHRDRIEFMFGLKTDINKIGYNVYQSKVAIGSGGLTGKGFMQGTQTKLNFVPEQSTDFIFCTVGEEWGFLRGSLPLILLYGALLIRIIILAERQRLKFARVYGYCVASIFFFHFGVNIAMTIGLMPVIGIPLPFISAGGSSLWSFTVLLFIFLKLNAANQNKGKI
jgi:rod shape determining protein RodA